MSTFGIVMIVLGIFVLSSFIFGAKSHKPEEKQGTTSSIKSLDPYSRFLADKNMTSSDIFNSKLKYIDGYPSNSVHFTEGNIIYFANRKDKIFAYSINEHYFKDARYLFEISKDSISEITIEDQSTIEKKITVGRLLLVGIFAFAWKKKKTNEIYFLVITFNDGKFNHNVVFQSEGKDAHNRCNTARNNLINWCKV